MDVKICKKCGEVKELPHFYTRDNSCKDCRKALSKEREEVKRLDPVWVEKERKRHRDKYYRLKYKDKHKPTKDEKRIATNIYREKYPEKYKAYIASQRVPVPKGLERHHWSYNKKHHKDILCLSKKNHNQLHRFLVYDKDYFMYRTIINIGIFEVGELLDTKEKHSYYYTKIKNLG